MIGWAIMVEEESVGFLFLTLPVTVILCCRQMRFDKLSKEEESGEVKARPRGVRLIVLKVEWFVCAVSH